jgi:hypothetical protein
MSKPREAGASTRREFFRLAGLGAGAAAAAGLTSKAATAAEQVKRDDRGSGYQETAHVKTYYELARF